VQLQARLIDDLLDLTRIARGKLQLTLERVDANALVRDAIEIAGSAIAAKKLHVSAEFDATKAYILATPSGFSKCFGT